MNIPNPRYSRRSKSHLQTQKESQFQKKNSAAPKTATKLVFSLTQWSERETKMELGWDSEARKVELSAYKSKVQFYSWEKNLPLAEDAPNVNRNTFWIWWSCSHISPHLCKIPSSLRLGTIFMEYFTVSSWEHQFFLFSERAKMLFIASFCVDPYKRYA